LVHPSNSPRKMCARNSLLGNQGRRRSYPATHLKLMTLTQTTPQSRHGERKNITFENKVALVTGAASGLGLATRRPSPIWGHP
jgi:hypothetical protein